jgi:hypothetical protein
MKVMINNTVDKKEFDTLKKWSEYQDTKSIKDASELLKKYSELQSFNYQISESN